MSPKENKLMLCGLALIAFLAMARVVAAFTPQPSALAPTPQGNFSREVGWGCYAEYAVWQVTEAEFRQMQSPLIWI